LNPGAWRLEVFDSLPSTSDLCTARAAAGEPEGLAVLARQQTAGRGSWGRHWQSPTGNLYLSVLLRPRAPHATSHFVLVAAVALAETLAAYLPDPGALAIKWPNDVLLHGHKLAGILLDASHRGDSLDWLVIGIGANLASAPTIPGRATACLAQETPAPSPEAVAAALLGRLAHWREVWLAGDLAEIRAAWLARTQPVGTPIKLARDGVVTGGTFAGLDHHGSVLLEIDGRLQPFATGEVLLG
jgi:BirA family transcriptional regulator, biotin operon repressor / biotin---[acetyl-CoA-carboxylase] ligase